MHFHHWQTILDESRQFHGKEWRKRPYDEQYRDELNALLTHQFKDEKNRLKRVVRLGVERLWELSGRPYYRVHPQMALRLGNVHLEKIPGRYIEIPEGFHAINICFSGKIPIRVLRYDQPYYFGSAPELKDDLVGFRSVLFGKCDLRNDESIRQFAPSMFGQEYYILFLDEGCRTVEPGSTVQRLLCNMILLGVKPDETIPEAINRAADEAIGVEGVLFDVLRERLERLFRIVVSIGFLSNCPEDMLVIPDVLADDRRRHWEALEKNLVEEAERLVARARRRGRFGWNVGTDEMFVGERPFVSSSRSSGGGRELRYSHIREGHPHAVRFGPGRSKVKIKWYKPVRVRPDLPFEAKDVNCS